MAGPLMRFKIQYEHDVVFVRKRAQLLAELLGFHKSDQTRISTAVSEIVRNAYQYAGGGEVLFSVDDAGAVPLLGVTVQDQGPGLTRSELNEYDAAASPRDMGQGIRSTRKLMDHFRLESKPGRGTTVHMGKFFPQTAPQPTDSLLEEVASLLARTSFESPLEEIRLQNQQLLDTLEELRQKEHLLTRSNQELEEANQALRRSEERYRLVTELSGQLVYDCNPGTGETVWAGNSKDLTGYTLEELNNLGFSWWEDLVHPQDRPLLRSQWNRECGSGASWVSAYRIQKKDGQVIHVEDHGSLLAGTSRQNGRILGTIKDITERKAYEERLEHLTMHDQLTGLYNRAFFEEEMQRLGAGRDFPITVIAVDVDGLKLVNDTMGHVRGDELLQAGARALQRSLRASDILARMGGDEFAALLPRTDEKMGEEIAQRICENVARHNEENPELPLSMAVATATAASDKTPLEEIYRQADALMCERKLSSRSDNYGEIIEVLMDALAEKDYIAQGHADRLAAWCQDAGEKLGLSPHQLLNLARLARVHDLGKVDIPDSILFKKGPLTGADWKVLQQHATKGHHIARCIPELQSLAELVLRHHERWDGKGYPLGLKGEEIPLECRLFAIADAYDAMVSPRRHRQVRSREEARAELERCAGTQFDPYLVPVFLEVVENIVL